MKRILFLILFTAVLCGCDYRPYKEKDIIDISDCSIRRIRYNNHNYILFWENERSCVVHDPDCPCYKEKEN